MNDARTTRRNDSPTPLRAQRRTAGLVAQYIHELSGRHADKRRQVRAPVKTIQPCEGG